MSKTAHKAKYLHYLACAILKVFETYDFCIGDNFGYGEDCFIVDLYPYANAVYRECNDDDAFLESQLFVVVDELAECFHGSLMRQDAPEMEMVMPDMDEFELDIKRVIESIKSR